MIYCVSYGTCARRVRDRNFRSICPEAGSPARHFRAYHHFLLSVCSSADFQLASLQLQFIRRGYAEERAYTLAKLRMRNELRKKLRNLHLYERARLQKDPYDDSTRLFDVWQTQLKESVRDVKRMSLAMYVDVCVCCSDAVFTALSVLCAVGSAGTGLSRLTHRIPQINSDDLWANTNGGLRGHRGSFTFKLTCKAHISLLTSAFAE